MLRLFDRNGVDITNQTAYCDNPACLGEPWCTAWGICQASEAETATHIMQPQQQEEACGSGLLKEEQEYDNIFMKLSQQMESSSTLCQQESSSSTFLPDIDLPESSFTPLCLPVESSSTPLCHPLPAESTSTIHCDSSSSSRQEKPDTARFAKPKSEEEVAVALRNAVPKKTRSDTEYCTRVWKAWRESRIDCGYDVPAILEMDSKTMAYWLTRFVLEVRKIDGCEYPPNTLHHIVCGLMRHLRNESKPDIDFFKDVEFSSFTASLNAEMKQLQSMGIGSTRRQDEPLTEEEGELLWEKNILGDHSP